MPDPTDKSGLWINQRELTWAEAVDYYRDQMIDAKLFAAILTDLTRCEHGRHEGDPCHGCDGPSHGNPRLAADRIIGFSINGTPIRVPSRGEIHVRTAWRPDS